MNESNGTLLSVDIFHDCTLIIRCQTNECKKKVIHVFLRLIEPGTWNECDGYADPENDFEPKKFSRKMMSWRGKCPNCGREYESLMRITQGE